MKTSNLAHNSHFYPFFSNIIASGNITIYENFALEIINSNIYTYDSRVWLNPIANFIMTNGTIQFLDEEKSGRLIYIESIYVTINESKPLTASYIYINGNLKLHLNSSLHASKKTCTEDTFIKRHK